MTLPHFKPDAFFDYLKKHGCKLFTNDYADENIVVYEKDGIKIPIQIRSVYWYLYVVRVCQDFGITPPMEHLRVYQQTMRHMEAKKTEESKLKEDDGQAGAEVEEKKKDKE